MGAEARVRQAWRQNLSANWLSSLITKIERQDGSEEESRPIDRIRVRPEQRLSLRKIADILGVDYGPHGTLRKIVNYGLLPLLDETGDRGSNLADPEGFATLVALLRNTRTSCIMDGGYVSYLDELADAFVSNSVKPALKRYGLDAFRYYTLSQFRHLSQDFDSHYNAVKAAAGRGEIKHKCWQGGVIRYYLGLDLLTYFLTRVANVSSPEAAAKFVGIDAVDFEKLCVFPFRDGSYSVGDDIKPVCGLVVSIGKEMSIKESGKAPHLTKKTALTGVILEDSSYLLKTVKTFIKKVMDYAERNDVYVGAYYSIRQAQNLAKILEGTSPHTIVQALNCGNIPYTSDGAKLTRGSRYVLASDLLIYLFSRGLIPPLTGKSVAEATGVDEAHLQMWGVRPDKAGRYSPNDAFEIYGVVSSEASNFFKRQLSQITAQEHVMKMAGIFIDRDIKPLLEKWKLHPLSYHKLVEFNETAKELMGLGPTVIWNAASDGRIDVTHRCRERYVSALDLALFYLSRGNHTTPYINGYAGTKGLHPKKMVPIFEFVAAEARNKIEKDISGITRAVDARVSEVEQSYSESKLRRSVHLAYLKLAFDLAHRAGYMLRDGLFNEARDLGDAVRLRCQEGGPISIPMQVYDAVEGHEKNRLEKFRSANVIAALPGYKPLYQADYRLGVSTVLELLQSGWIGVAKYMKEDLQHRFTKFIKNGL